MEELEQRIAALELLAIEVGAFVDPLALDDARRSIKAGLENATDEDERTIRRQALTIIEDARNRYRPPAVGMKL